MNIQKSRIRIALWLGVLGLMGGTSEYSQGMPYDRNVLRATELARVATELRIAREERTKVATEYAPVASELIVQDNLYWKLLGQKKKDSDALKEVIQTTPADSERINALELKVGIDEEDLKKHNDNQKILTEKQNELTSKMAECNKLIYKLNAKLENLNEQFYDQ